MFGKCKKCFSSRRSQGIVEYIILVAVVITVLIVFLRKGGTFNRSYDDVIQTQADDIVGAATQIFPVTSGSEGPGDPGDLIVP